MMRQHYLGLSRVISMTKPLKERSELFVSLRFYFSQHKDLLYILSDRQREYVDRYAFCRIKDLPSVFPKDMAKRLTGAALEIRKESKRIWSTTGKANYIEATDIHDTHPKLYRFCQELKIQTLLDLDSFIEALKANNLQTRVFKLKYGSQILDLLDWYQTNRNVYRTTRNSISSSCPDKTD